MLRKIKKIKKPSLIFSITLVACLLYPQAQAIKFKHITIEDGLSQSSCFSVVQDHRGFIWTGTEAGLNKYDGYRFVIYKSDHRDSTSLSDSYVLSIHEDKDGVLWIGTFSGGLNKFDRETEQFTHYKHDPRNPDSLSHNCINSIYEDKTGILWIGTEDGLNRFDREKAKFTQYKYDRNNPNSLSHNKLSATYEDKDGVLWIGTNGGGLNKFDRRKKQFIHQHSSLDEYNEKDWKINKEANPIDPEQQLLDRLDNQISAPQPRYQLLCLLAGPFAYGEHGNNRGHAEDDTERRQGGPQPVHPKALDAQLYSSLSDGPTHNNYRSRL